ncbi:NnrS protein involved in response to NO [hydrothermal vent metagenome]|uniref:NnrS protein involved in response to NO n=1 Tax=hydrothermal vent metagenome TaxID=652676 RepID=A0A1W1BF25_9ZZZZ
MHMKFSEDSENSYFFSQPHQPFFVLAFINAVVIMFIFLLAYNGRINLAIPPSDFHAYGLTYLMFTPAFFAFLFTTFPRFSSTPVIEKKSYMRIFSFYYIGSVLFILGSIVSPILSVSGMLILLAGHLLGILILKNRYMLSPTEDKHDIFWILLAMVFGLVAHFLFIIGELFVGSFIGFSMEVSVYLYLFLLAFSVAQRMVPFFSHCMVERNDTLLRNVFLLLGLHILLEGIVTNSSFIVDLILAYIIAKELFRWQLPFPNPNPMLWILHLALYWIPVAFLFGAMSNFITLINGTDFLFLDIHILMLGFVFTILIGFGTRVTIGHSGNMMQAGLWEKILFNWTQVVVIIRLFTSMMAALGYNFLVLFDISVTVWLLMFILWAIRFFKLLIFGKKLGE